MKLCESCKGLGCIECGGNGAIPDGIGGGLLGMPIEQQMGRNRHLVSVNLTPQAQEEVLREARKAFAFGGAIIDTSIPSGFCAQRVPACAFPTPHHHSKIVNIDEHLIVAILNCWRYSQPQCIILPVSDGLPEDAKVERVWFSEGRRCWSAEVSHPSFEVVPSGSEFPHHDEFIELRVMRRVPVKDYEPVE